MKFEVTAPNGKRFEVEAPEGATEREILDFVQRQGAQQFLSRTEAQSLERPSQQFSGAIRGLRDPIDAGAQLLVRGAEKIGLTSPEEVERVDEIVREAERDYRQNWRAVDPGLDIPRIAGNVFNPTNVAIASRFPQAASLVGRMGTGAAAGATFGALQPVTEGDFPTQKKKQIGMGALAGGALPVAAGATARMIRPNTRPEVRQLMSEGITPTPGQVVGGASRRIEQAMTSLPIIGDAVQAGQRRAVQQFNRAALDRALSPIGEKLPKNIEVGNRAVQYVSDRLSRAYDNLLPKLKVIADRDFITQLTGLRSLTQSMPDAQRAQFDRILQSEVINRFTSPGRMRGETMKEVESKLGEIIRGYSRSSDYDQRRLGSAIREVQSALRSLVERSNPQFAGELRKINEGYSNFLRVQNAAGRLGSKEGIFSPAQLSAGVRSMDPSKAKSSFARGSAQMQDLATAGESVLGSRVPDSGTPFRTLLNLGLLGGAAYVNPYIAASGLAATSAYTPAGQRLAAALLGQRPQIATPMARAVRQSTPYLTPAAASLVNGLNR